MYEDEFDLAEQIEIDNALGEVYEEPDPIVGKLVNRELPMPEGFKIENDGECYRLLTHLSPAGYYPCSFADAAAAYRQQHG